MSLPQNRIKIGVEWRDSRQTPAAEQHDRATGRPDADTIAQPTSGWQTSTMYIAISEPNTSTRSAGGTVFGSAGARWVNRFAMRAATITRITAPSVMCTASNAAYGPSRAVMANPINRVANTRTAVTQCRTRVRNRCRTGSLTVGPP